MSEGSLYNALMKEMGRARSYFKSTGNLKWIVRYADVSKQRARLRKPSSSEPHLPTVEEFAFALRTPSALRTNDKLQTVSNFIMAQGLSRHLEQQDPAASAMTALVGSGLSEVLELSVFPSSPEAIRALKDDLVNSLPTLKLGNELEERVFSVLKDNTKFVNLLHYTLTLAYIQALKNVLIANPLLALVPPEKILNKTAHLILEAAVDPEGTRLSQFIDAIRLAQAMTYREYNKIAMYSRLQQNPIAKRFFGQVPRAEEMAIFMPRIFRVTNQYLAVYNKLANDLQEYMNNNRGIYYIPGTKTRLTSNPPISERGPAGLMKFLTPDHIFKGLKGFKPTDIYGNAASLKKSMAIKASDLQKVFSSTEVPGELSNEIIDQFNTSMPGVLDFTYEGEQSSAIDIFSKILKPDSNITPAGLYSDLEMNLKQVLEQYNSQNVELKSNAVSESLESYEPHRRQENSKNMAQYEEGMVYALEEAVGGLAEKYKGAVSRPDILREQIRKLVLNQILPISPFTERYIRSSDLQYPSGESGSKMIKSDVKKYFDDHFITVVSSPQYRHAEELADDDYAEGILGTETDYTEWVENSAKNLADNDELLDELGISNNMIEAQLAELHAGPTENRTERAKRLISEIIEEPLTKDPEELQSILGEIPLDALYVHLANIFDQWREEHGFVDAMINVATLRAPRTAAKDIPDQVSAYLNGYFISTRQRTVQGRVSAENKISASSMAGRIQEWHLKHGEIIEKMQEAGRPTPFIWGHLFRKANQGFSAKSRDVAEEYVRKILKENADDPRVTDSNWDDVAMPRPRTPAELAHIVSAFADPLPGVRIEEGEATSLAEAIRSVPTKYTARAPGQIISEKESGGLDTPRNHLRRIYSKIGYKVMPSMVGGEMQTKVANPINEIRALLHTRRQEILQIPEWREAGAELNGFDIDRHKSPNVNSFIEGSKNYTGKVFSKKDALMYISTLSGDILSADQRKGLANSLSSTSRTDPAFESKESFLTRLPAYMRSSGVFIEEGKQAAVLNFIESAAEPTIVGVEKDQEEPPESKPRPTSQPAPQQISATELISTFFNRLGEYLDQSQQIGTPNTKRELTALGRIVVSVEEMAKEAQSLLSGQELSEQEREAYQAFRERAAGLIASIQSLLQPGEAGSLTPESFVKNKAIELRYASQGLLTQVAQVHGSEVAEDLRDLLISVTENDDYRYIIHPDGHKEFLQALQAIVQTAPERLLPAWRAQVFPQIQQMVRNQLVIILQPEYGTEAENEYFEAKDKYYYV